MEIESREKVKRLLRELFQFDTQDLDFGIYRIMNFKRDAIEKFIEVDLLRAAEEEFKEYAKVGVADLQKEVERLKNEIDRDFGAGTIDDHGRVMRLGDAPKIQQYLGKLKELDSAQVTQTQIDDVFNHVYEFFSRYYDKGDFVSKKRYGGREKYSVPYNGEEILFHWANNDQYYAKSGEYFKKYTFSVGGYRINFVLREAEAELNNVKEEKRYFLPCKEDAFGLDDEKKELDIFFNWRVLIDEEKRRFGTRNVQETIVSDTVRGLLSQIGDKGPGIELRRKVNDEKSILENHLKKYAEKNTTDYFIHKNLKVFLERELEFYLKNEVLDLDEIEQMDERNIRISKAKIRAIKAISEKIIDFLSQIENFQRMLFEKKKLVLRTDYSMTLYLVPEKFYKEIGENEKQVAEWKELFKLDKMTSDTLPNTQRKRKLDVGFLKLYKYLMLDTRHFSEDFKWRLLASFDNLDEAVDGVLIKSENWQALNMLREKYQRQVQCVYIDPPYNTNASPIIYKNDYRHSSWLALMDSRIRLGKVLLRRSGVQCTTIDDAEFIRLRELISLIFGDDNVAGVVTIKNNPSGRSTVKGFSVAHEYAIFSFASEESLLGMIPRTPEQAAQYDENDEQGLFQWRSFMRSGGANDFRTARPKLHYPLIVSGDKIRLPKLKWNSSLNKWELAERPDHSDQVLLPIANGVEYTWRLGIDSLRERLGDLRLRKARDGKMLIEIKFRIDEEGILPKTVWDDKYVNATAYGTTLLRHIIGIPQTFPFPKSIYAVKNSLIVCRADPGTLVLDYFAGSGTTAHAVIDLNREDGGNRKYILVEMGDWFETVMLPRIKKVVFCDKWKEGMPVGGNGISHFLKYQYLEQHEDTLNNIVFRALDKTIQETLDGFGDYFLRYMLEYETRESPARLTMDKFKTPFDYKIKTINGNLEKEETVDLIETFNYLLGLWVEKMRVFKDGERIYRVVFGKEDNNKIVVIWRNTKDLDLERDKKFIEETILVNNESNTIYINGDSYVKNAQPIEPEFKRLMGA